MEDRFFKISFKTPESNVLPNLKHRVWKEVELQIEIYSNKFIFLITDANSSILFILAYGNVIRP